MGKPVIYCENNEVRDRLEEFCSDGTLDFVYTAQRKKNIFGDKAIIIGGKNHEFYKIIRNYKTGEILKGKKLNFKEVDAHAKSYFNKQLWLQCGI